MGTISASPQPFLQPLGPAPISVSFVTLRVTRTLALFPLPLPRGWVFGSRQENWESDRQTRMERKGQSMQSSGPREPSSPTSGWTLPSGRSWDSARPAPRRGGG